MNKLLSPPLLFRFLALAAGLPAAGRPGTIGCLGQRGLTLLGQLVYL